MFTTVSNLTLEFFFEMHKVSNVCIKGLRKGKQDKLAKKLPPVRIELGTSVILV